MTNILWGLFLTCAIIFIYGAVAGISTYLQRKGIVGGTNLDRFFIECVLSECNDFTKVGNIKKAERLANGYGLKYPNGIEALYKKGLKAHETLSKNIDQAEKNKKIAAEQEEFARLTCYSEYFGTNKRIAMLEEYLRNLKSDEKAARKFEEMLVRSGYQREKDWSTWGGVASGLAGPVAGAITALDIQAQNAEIRAQNEANRRAKMPAYAVAHRNVANKNDRIASVQREIEAVRKKGVSDMSAKEVMEKLELVNVTVNVSETGAFHVRANAKVKSELRIFDNVKAVADGTITAHVCDGEKEIGTAKMVLPIYGLSGNVRIVGMGLSGAEKGKKYTVKFTPHKLWLMEA